MQYLIVTLITAFIFTNCNKNHTHKIIACDADGLSIYWGHVNQESTDCRSWCYCWCPSNDWG